MLHYPFECEAAFGLLSREFWVDWLRTFPLRARQAAEKRLNAVILSAAKNLAPPLSVNYAKDLGPSILKAMRDSSSPPAPQNDSADEQA